jgi:hypothetical protein
VQYGVQCAKIKPQIEKLLAEVGTSKSRILEARIWLKAITPLLIT